VSAIKLTRRKSSVVIFPVAFVSASVCAFQIFPAIRSTGGVLSFTVYFVILYGYGFLSWGFTDRRKILHADWATSQTDPLVFGVGG